MAFVHLPEFRKWMSAAQHYPVQQVPLGPNPSKLQEGLIFKVGKTWTNAPFYEYGWPGDAITPELLPRLPPNFLIKVESDNELSGPPEGRGRAWHYGRLARLELQPQQSEDEFFKSRDHQIRKAINKAHRHSFGVQCVTASTFDLDLFYDRYARYIQKRHGSPPLSKEHFGRGFEFFGNDSVISKVTTPEGEVAAILLGFVDRPSSSCQITDIILDSKYTEYRVSDLAHWGMACWLRASKIRYLDFGICRYQGQEYYKAKWGCTFTHLYYWSSRTDHRAPDPQSPFYRLARRVWKNLPYQIHKSVGPLIRRRLGA